MKTIIIVGMHRTGSSLVARIFHEFGVNLGSNMMEKDSDNMEGYYENSDFVDLNNALLKEAGRAWNYPVTIQDPDKRCKELIDKNKSELWGWKDNRTAFTFKAYERYLENVLFVVTHREREAVINSMLRSEGYMNQFLSLDRNPKYLGRLYDLHYEAIDSIAKGHNRIDVHYEDLISNKFYNPELNHYAKKS